jgi:hypothetical protein
LLQPNDVLSLNDGEDGRPVLTVMAAAPRGVHQLEASTGEFNINKVERSIKRTTAISRAVLNNQAAVQLNAVSFLTTILAKLEALHNERSNSEDAAVFENLKHEVEAFLAGNAAGNEASIVAAIMSIAKGLSRWWNNAPDIAREKTLNTSLFAAGLSFCALAGAYGVSDASIVTVGALIGGKNVADALTAYAKALSGSSE